MIFMMKKVESEKCSIYNIFPMRTNIIPKYIKLDTSSLVQLLVSKGKKSNFNNKIKKYENVLWVFKTGKGIFKKHDYSFNHIILTDGVGVSIIFLRKDLTKKKKLPKLKSRGAPAPWSFGQSPLDLPNFILMN